jgi:Flp pilus assembly protein protease CpaA
MWVFLIVLVLAVLVISTVTDLRKREVPDWLSYSAIVAGFGSRLIWSAYSWDYHPILDGAVGFSVFFILACALYYLGQWGGGDSKLLMAVGVCLGLNLDINHIILAFVVNAIWLGGVYGALWSVYLAANNWKNFKEEYKTQLKKHGFVRFIPLAVLLVIVFLSFVLDLNPVLEALLIVMVVFVPLLFYVSVFVRAVDISSMRKFVSPAEITEGDWVVNDIVVNKKRICGPRDLGISLKQIEELKKYHIRRVLIKIGVPFVPALLLAYLFTLFFGNPLFWLV